MEFQVRTEWLDGYDPSIDRCESVMKVPQKKKKKKKQYIHFSDTFKSYILAMKVLFLGNEMKNLNFHIDGLVNTVL